MHIVSKGTRRTISSICASVQLFCLIVCTLLANGSIWWLLKRLEVYWRRAANRNCMICLRCSLQWNTSLVMLEVSPLATTPYRSHNRSNYTAVKSSVIQPADTWRSSLNQHRVRRVPTTVANQEWEAGGSKEGRIRFWFLPLKEMKTRGAASGSLIRRFPRAELDRARRKRAVHRPAGCMVERPPAAHGEIKNTCEDEKKGLDRFCDSLFGRWIVDLQVQTFKDQSTFS